MKSTFPVEDDKSILLSSLYSGKSKSTHDVLQDPKLSNVPAVEKKGGDESSESDLSGDEKPVASSSGGVDAVKSKLISRVIFPIRFIIARGFLGTL